MHQKISPFAQKSGFEGVTKKSQVLFSYPVLPNFQGIMYTNKNSTLEVSNL